MDNTQEFQQLIHFLSFSIGHTIVGFSVWLSVCEMPEVPCHPCLWPPLQRKANDPQINRLPYRINAVAFVGREGERKRLRKTSKQGSRTIPLQTHVIKYLMEPDSETEATKAEEVKEKSSAKGKRMRRGISSKPCLMLFFFLCPHVNHAPWDCNGFSSPSRADMTSW